ncbi:MAG: GntR family transcriptional regulator [Gammaproteobacteria bacterium]|nr:GntR family transcriptional regulator [Gammaproteobacteria bacterium]
MEDSTGTDRRFSRDPDYTAANAGAVPPITSRTYDRLRASILSGELAPGTEIKIDELKSTFEVAASLIREALSLAHIRALGGAH